MFYSIHLNENFQHRLMFNADLFINEARAFKHINVMLDTGCYNTMIPLKLARVSGTPIGMKRPIVIGASVIETEAFIINTR